MCLELQVITMTTITSSNYSKNIIQVSHSSLDDSVDFTLRFLFCAITIISILPYRAAMYNAALTFLSRVMLLNNINFNFN